jgi:hypothetical protein
LTVSDQRILICVLVALVAFAIWRSRSTLHNRASIAPASSPTAITP